MNIGRGIYEVDDQMSKAELINLKALESKQRDRSRKPQSQAGTSRQLAEAALADSEEFAEAIKNLGLYISLVKVLEIYEAS